MRKFSGHEFEDYVLGVHEMQKFEIKLNSSFAANFANVVLAQPKDHDPAEPKDVRLIRIKKGVEKLLGSTVHIYICTKLPIDVLHSTDLLIVCWEKRSFVTIDLKTYEREGSQSRAQMKLWPKDLTREEFPVFCATVAEMLKSGGDDHHIRNSTLALLGRPEVKPELTLAGQSP